MDPISYAKQDLPANDVPEDQQVLLEKTNEGSPNESGVRPISLDSIFEKIGFGPYQLRLTIILGMIAAAEGAQITIATLCMTILQNTWGYDNLTQSIVISVNFIGVVVGGFFSGFFADKYGRAKPTVWALVLITVFHVLAAFAQEVIFFSVVRFLIGCFMGFSAPIAFTIIVENMPKNHRGKLVMIALSFMFLGQLIECLIAFATIDNLLTGDWRALIFWSTSFLILTLVLNMVFLDESMRYQLVMGEYDKAFQTIDKMMKVNKAPGQNGLTEQEKLGLKAWIRELSTEVTDNEIASVGALFKPKYRKITLVIWLGYFIISFVYYGIVLCLPYMLMRISEEDQAINDAPVYNESDLPSLAVSILMEAVSVIIAIFVIDSVPVDRRKSLAAFYLLTAVACGGAVICTSREAFVFWATMTKIFINVCSCYYYLFTVEIYPTKYRATGTGFAIAIGKFGTIAMPWICLPLTQVYLLGPFVLFLVLCLLACISIFGLTINTKGMDLM